MQHKKKTEMFFSVSKVIKLALFFSIYLAMSIRTHKLEDLVNTHFSPPIRAETEHYFSSSSTVDSSALTSTPAVLIPSYCDAPSRNKNFDSIYLNGRWGKKLLSPSDFYGEGQWPPHAARKVSASGGGSELGHASEMSLKILKDTIKKYNISSMVDVPCGDANWIFDSFVTDSLPLYLGLDIVRPVIEVNKQRFKHHSNKIFLFWDATSCELPRFINGKNGEQESFELVHVRDVIQHMNPLQGVQYFCNIFQSEAKVLVTTTFPEGFNRPNVKEGGAYRNNLEQDPFSFPKSDSCTPTHPKHESDMTCVYNLFEPWVKDFVARKCPKKMDIVSQ